MKRRLFFIVLLLVSIQLASQKVFDCEPVRVQKLDSVVNFAKEAENDNYFPVDVFLYHYDDEGRYPLVERLSLPSRTPVNRQDYFFDEAGRKTHYILQAWNGTEYTESSRSDYLYNDNGYLAREVFSGPGEGGWIPYQQHWYNYNEDNITETYLRQMMYTEGVWTDFSYKNYIYGTGGKLIERNEQRIADGVIFWVELFTYDDLGRTATRIRQSLKYNPSTRTSALVNLNKQIYSYDIYGEISEYRVETWINDSWVLTGKSVYYRTLLYGTRVPMCYNGSSVAVPVRSVARFLALGALLGPCECLFPIDDNDDPAPVAKFSKGCAVTEVVIYPNPASSQITVWFPVSEARYSDLNIYDRFGSLIIKKRVSDQNVTVDISRLKPGSYHLSVSGEGGSFITTFIKKQ